VGAPADLVRLAYPAGELLVELVERADPEVVNEQALRVWRGVPDSRVLDAPLQVEVAVETATAGHGAREPAPAPLERYRRLCDRVLEGPAGRDQPAVVRMPTRMRHTCRPQRGRRRAPLRVGA